MKRLIIILAVGLAAFAFAGCVSSAQGVGSFFNTSAAAEIDLRGEATNIVYFGMFGEKTYPPVEMVARDNGITKIATMERYRRIGVFGLWIEFTTIVTGTGPGVPAAPAEEE